MKPRSEAGAEARILDAAMEELRKNGRRRLTVVEIAAQLGMSHANVYRYFESKAALVDALMLRWLQPVEAELRVIADGPDPAYDKLERLISALNSAYRDRLESEPVLFQLFAESVDASRGVTRRHRLRVQSEIQRVVDEGLASGLFAIGDQRRALGLVYDTMHRFIHPVCVRLDASSARAPLELRRDRVMRLLLRGLQTGRMAG
ncbi:MAG: TetR/AcrR family transcriptional regulator [Hyphomicrobiales bacterium]|nr:TetR/AcrR family transcriptional regulator [Hyphomicrobiales bacterium]